MPTKTSRGSTVILNAVEGWGKTTLAANAPGAMMVMAPGETGYTTLYDHGLVPAIPTASPSSWEELLATVDNVPAECRHLSLDALGGFERLCHQFVCVRDFKGVWGEYGFDSFQRGAYASVSEWIILLSKLETLRNRGTSILLLSHVRIEQFPNPSGADFSRYVADCHKKTWGVTHKWADAVLFGTFYSVVETRAGKEVEVLKKGKGIGGTERVLYTQRRDAYDAKNRFNLPEVIDIPGDRNTSWPAFAAHVFKE